MEILGIVFTVAVILLIIVKAAHDTSSREHVHGPDHWDGWTERCRCGVEASSRVNAQTGLSCISFKEWDQ